MNERRADFRFVRLKFLVRTLNEDRREGSRKSGEGSELIPKQSVRVEPQRYTQRLPLCTYTACDQAQTPAW